MSVFHIGEFDDVTSTNNSGFIQRSSLFREQNTVTGPYKTEPTVFWFPLDICKDIGYLPPGVPVKICLKYQDPTVALLAAKDTDVTFQIVNIELFVAIGELSAESWSHLEAQMKKIPCTLNFTRREVRNFTLAPGNSTFSEGTLHTPLSEPFQIVVGLCKSDAFTGKIHLNPYNFKNSFEGADNKLATITQIQLTLNQHNIDGLPVDSPLVDYMRVCKYNLSAKLQSTNNNIIFITATRLPRISSNGR
jgi:hypothetical protein